MHRVATKKHCAIFFGPRFMHPNDYDCPFDGPFMNFMLPKRRFWKAEQSFQAGLRDAHFALNFMSGSVVIEVTVPGEQVDGATLARLLESDVGTRSLKMTLGDWVRA
jgi:hypothetical protein